MAIFIPAGGSMMVRGGPIFWNAPLRREHAAGNIPFLGDPSFPLGTGNFFVSAISTAASFGVDCVEFFPDHGGRVSFPVILYFEFLETTAIFDVNTLCRVFVNGVLRLTTPTYTRAGLTTGTIGGAFWSVQWHIDVTLLDLPPNSRILFRVECTRTGGVLQCRCGLRISARPNSSLLGMLSNRPLTEVRTQASQLEAFAPASPPVTSVGERPALPIRAVSPMMPIAQRARIAV